MDRNDQIVAAAGELLKTLDQGPGGGFLVKQQCIASYNAHLATLAKLLAEPDPPRFMPVEIREALAEAGNLIDDALTNHIYDEQNGDVVPDDCRYTAASKNITELLELYDDGGGARIVVDVEGGNVQTVYAAGRPLPVAVTVIDRDAEGSDRAELFMVQDHGAEDWDRAHVTTYDMSHAEPMPNVEDAEDERFDADFAE